MLFSLHKKLSGRKATAMTGHGANRRKFAALTGGVLWAWINPAMWYFGIAAMGLGVSFKIIGMDYMIIDHNYSDYINKEGDTNES